MTKIVYKGVEVTAHTDEASVVAAKQVGSDALVIERNGKAVAVQWKSPDSVPAKAIDFAMIMAIVELILKILGLFGGDDE